VSVEEAIVARLQAAGIAGGRVYQLQLPQRPTLPAVRVQLISEPTFDHLRGGLRLKRARVQTDAYVDQVGADPYATVRGLAEAIDAALTGGPPWVQGDVEIRFVTRQGRMPLTEPGELRQLRVLQDYTVWHRPTGTS
jgi:hypothetical protein